jgi:hypothetical protein
MSRAVVTAIAAQKGGTGVALPGEIDINLAGASERIGGASRQLAKLAGGVRSVREKTEQLGHALS